MSYENVPKNLTEKAVLVRDGRPDYITLSSDPAPVPTADEAGAIWEHSDTGSRYRWTSAVWVQVADQGRGVVASSDFLVEVAKGNVIGHSLLPFQFAGTLDTTLKDVWGGSADMVYPASAETWEIVSDNVNDTSAGTGARAGVLVSLDSNLEEQTTTFTLNGTTAVTLSNTHLRPKSVTILTAGSSGTNEGTIEVRVSGGGDPRNYIPPEKSTSFDGHLTIPAGKTAYFLQTFIIYPKNLSGSGVTKFRDTQTADAAWIASGDIPLYQNMINFEILAKLPVAEQIDVRIQAKTDTGSGYAAFVYELLLVDN